MNLYKQNHMYYRVLAFVCFIASMNMSAIAQIDEDRMFRDVKIMQRALQEMFKEGKSYYEVDGQNIFIASGYDSRTNEAKYIPGMGIMLQAPTTKSNFQFYYNEKFVDSDENSEEDEETFKDKFNEEQAFVEETLKEFLKDYGDLARQLPEDEYVMIKYESQGSKGRAIRINENQNPFTYNEINRKILVKVRREDIDAYRAGEIDEAQFYAKVETTVTTSEALDTKEFKVFATILGSLFSEENDLQEDFDEDDDPRFKQSRFYHKSGQSNKIEYELLNGYGAVYNLSLGYALEGYHTPYAVTSYVWSDDDQRVKVIKEVEVIEEAKTIRSINDDEVIVIEGQGDVNDIEIEGQEESEEEESDEEGETDSEEDLDEEEIDEEIESYLRERDNVIEDIYEDTFQEELMQYIVDYGRTLRSLKADEYLVINVELPACYECTIPANLELKIKREELNRYENGELSFDGIQDKIQINTSGSASEQKDIKSMIAPRSARSLRGRARVIERNSRAKSRRYRNDE